MGLSEKWRRYYNDPFGFMDNLRLTVKGVNLNLFQKTHHIQKTALRISLIMLAGWLICGFDSAPAQFLHVVYEGVPAFLQGQATLQDLTNIYNFYYGKEMHYSAFVFYCLMFWALSIHFDQGLRYTWDRVFHKKNRSYLAPTGLGISKSRNIAFSVSLTCLAVGVFEWFWLFSFAYWHNQPWIITWKPPQIGILFRNFAFTIVGIIGVLTVWANSYILEAKQIVGRVYRFRCDWKAWVLITLTVGSVLLWWFYPWPVEQVTVDLATGESWTNSRRFPQTLYTIDLDPSDDVMAGVWFYVQNDPVHGLNTIVKILITLTIAYIGMVQKVEGHES